MKAPEGSYYLYLSCFTTTNVLTPSDYGRLINKVNVLWLWSSDSGSVTFCLDSVLSSLDTSRISGDCPKAVVLSDRNPKLWKGFWKDTRLNPKPFFPPSVLGFNVTLQEHCPTRKALPGFFLCIFSSLTCLKKRRNLPVFSKRDLLQWKVSARLYWDLLISRRYHHPACHYS
jgi:hypothetical protein